MTKTLFKFYNSQYYVLSSKGDSQNVQSLFNISCTSVVIRRVQHVSVIIFMSFEFKLDIKIPNS